MRNLLPASLLVSALVLCFACRAPAEPSPVGTLVPNEATQIAHVMGREVDGHRYRYLLHVPRAAEPPPGGWPLVLFLHGAGERGDDLERVKVHGPPKLLATIPVLRGCVLVSPQCPSGAWWKPDALAALLGEVLDAQPGIDPDRLYATGLSMGGYGTWGLVAAHPGLLAAAIPICGGGDPHRLWDRPDVPDSFDLEELTRSARVPVRAFHGAADQVVPVAESELLVRELRAVGGDVELTIYPGVGHDSWTRTYENPEIWRWLLEQRRTIPDRPHP